ncbi:hypothetical protein CK203_065036 [Vitis vinifera]|uniref:Uncharacterized protein n=1 Tax=Vitis vinifera TaxID=29760 RepID=A0A438G7B1_VITVI|nr:hypothetical protein CK203_065036 [Vitis vinifera]
MSPFQALYGRPPPMIPHYQLGSSPVNEVDQNLASRDDLLHQLKLNLHQASNRMKQIADSKRRDIEFNEDDLVFLRLHPYRQQTVFKRASQKLTHRFYGPFPIEKRIGKTIGDSNARCPTLPPLTDDGALIIEPAEIIDTRWFQKGGKFFEECLVKWKNLPVEDATWENAVELHDRFPDLNLEDKVPVKVGGSQESNASNGARFEVEMKELQPLQADRSKLKEGFSKFHAVMEAKHHKMKANFAAVRNQPFVANFLSSQPNSEDFSSEDERLGSLSLGVRKAG